MCVCVCVTRARTWQTIPAALRLPRARYPSWMPGGRRASTSAVGAMHAAVERVRGDRSCCSARARLLLRCDGRGRARAAVGAQLALRPLRVEPAPHPLLLAACDAAGLRGRVTHSGDGGGVVAAAARSAWLDVRTARG